MTPDPDQIQRLGFEAWADNVIVNALEFMGEPTEVTADNGNSCLVIRVHAGEAHASVRAYVPGKGWQHHDRTIKLKGGRP